MKTQLWLGTLTLVCLVSAACGGGSNSNNNTVANPPSILDQSLSSVAADRTQAVADGVDAPEVKVTLIDTGAHPLAGIKVDLQVDGEATVRVSGVTDATGLYTGKLASLSTGALKVTAIAHLPSGLTPLFDQVTLQFVAGAATHLVFSQSPVQVRAGSTLSPGVEVSVEDPWGHVVTDASPDITVSLSSGPAGGILLGTLTRKAAAGVARFDDLALTTAGGGYALAATANDLKPATSPTFEIIAGLPSPFTSSLKVVSGWEVTADGVNGFGLALQLTDGFGNPCVGMPVAITSSGSANRFDPSGFGTSDAAGKFATTLFSTRAEFKNLTATALGLALSGQVHFVPGPIDPAHSSITLTGSPAIADGSSRVVITGNVADAFGNPSSAWLQWTLTDPLTQQVTNNYFSPDSTGYVTGFFTSTTAGHRVLTAISNGVTVYTGGVDFVAGPASQLRLLQLPSALYAGEAFPLAVAITDANGNTVPDATGAITLGLQTTGSVRPALTGTVTRTAVNGVAQFDDLRIDRAASGLRLAATSAALQGQSALFDVHAWRSLGPDGGEISAVLATDTNTVYVGTRGGGVFKSTDGGKTYAAANAGLTGFAVTGLSSMSNGLFATTSDGGVFLSSDGGAHWVARNGGLTSFDVRALVWQGSISAHVVGTAVGVFKSTDQGGSWTPINSGLSDLDVRALLSWNSLLFAATGTGRVFESTDGGASWTDVGVDLGGPATALITASNGILLASSRGGGLFQSKDQGKTWTRLAAVGSTQLNGLYFRSWNELYALSEDAGLLRSSDQGASWTALTSGLPTAVRAMGGLSYYGTFHVGTAQGMYRTTDSGASFTETDNAITATRVSEVTRDPAASSAFYAASDDGIFHTGDGGRTWAARSGGLPFTRFVSVAVDPSNPQVLYAASADSGAFKSTDSGQSWAQANQGLTQPGLVAVRVDPASPSTLYALASQGTLFKSTDGAASWSPCPTQVSQVGTALAIASGASGSTVYLGTGDSGVWSTSDGCASLTSASGAAATARVGSLWVGASGKVYAGTEDVGALALAPGGSWSSLGGIPSAVRAIAEDPSSPTTLYAAIPDGTLRSDDSGASWSLTSEAPTSGTGFAFDPAAPGVIWEATGGHGVLRSSSGGR